MARRQLYLCRDGHEKYPFALFAHRPKYNAAKLGWDSVLTGDSDSTYRLSLSDHEAQVMFGNLPERMLPGTCSPVWVEN